MDDEKTREANRERGRRWRQNNRELFNQRHREYNKRRRQKPEVAAAAAQRSQAWIEANRDRHNDWARRYYRTNRDHILGLTRAKRYGISEEQYWQLPGAATNTCAICGRPQCRKSKDGFVAALNVDHDHVTGKTRGLLCDHCNRILGSADDDPNRLRAAARYLEETA